MNKEEIKQWIEQNLVMQDEARSITDQSKSAFNQSVATGKIKPFVEFGEARKTRLYLRSDLEEYAKNKRRNYKMRVWEREGYIVREVEFDHDLHEFEVVKNDEVIATITPADLDDMTDIVAALDSGEDVEGWEDGMGNVISIPEK